jgi:HPt (histidine-containing phosphotransfer) domain-containing protein
VMAEDRTRTKASGMQGHVAKPVDPAELYLALLGSIKEGDYTANLPSGEEITAAESAAQQHPPLPDFLPGLDIKQGLGRLGNNENLFVQLLSDLMAQYADTAASMQQLAAQDKQDELRAAAHKLRGIAVNLGAVDVGSGAEAIEQTVLSGERVTERQLAGLAEAIVTLGQSHAELLEGRKGAGEPTPSGEGIDTGEIFASLKSAVATSDPGATDLVDQLLSAVDKETELSQLLTRARGFLDNFSFPEAELLLAEIEEGLAETV